MRLWNTPGRSFPLALKDTSRALTCLVILYPGREDLFLRDHRGRTWHPIGAEGAVHFHRQQNNSEKCTNPAVWVCITRGDAKTQVREVKGNGLQWILQLSALRVCNHIVFGLWNFERKIKIVLIRDFRTLRKSIGKQSSLPTYLRKLDWGHIFIRRWNARRGPDKYDR